MENRPEKPAAESNWFERRADAHFARCLPGLEELQATLRQPIQAELSPDEALDWIIDAPSQGRLSSFQPDPRPFRWRDWFAGRLPFLPWRFTPHWALVLTVERLLLCCLSSGKPPQVISVPFSNILLLRSGIILLSGWLQVSWVEHGAACEETVYFNAVCEKIFARLTERIRCRLVEMHRRLPTRPVEEQGWLGRLPYKFQNLVPLRMLLPAEPVRKVLFRPATWKKSFGLFHALAAPRMAVILTENFLLIGEEGRTGVESSSGLITTFLPLANLQQVALRLSEGHLQWLVRVERSGAGQELIFDFPLEMEANLRQLDDALKENLAFGQ